MSVRPWMVLGVLAAIGLAGLGVWLFLNVAHTEGFWAFVGVIVGGLITAIVSIGGELLRGWHESRLDTEKRENDRWIERMRIQRDTLLELQVALGDWMRVQAQTELADVRNLRSTGRYGLHGDELGAAQLTTIRRLIHLTERVKDDALRRALTELRALGMPPMPTDEEEVRSASARLTMAAVEVQSQLGEVLRAYL